jgi:transposase
VPLSTSITWERTPHPVRRPAFSHLLKLLETANIKLASVATDVFGVSGRRMLEALIENATSLPEMAQLAKGKLRNKIPQLELALEGRLQELHRFLLRLEQNRLDAIEADVAVLEQQIQQTLQPYASQLALLQEIPGVDLTLATVIIAELSVDMTVFQSVSQMASWAGVRPGNNESAGKRKSSRIPRGNVYLKTALVEAANAAARAKGTYLREQFYRLKARRGYCSPWIQARCRRHRPQDSRLYLPHAFAERFLQRLGRPLS